MKDFALILAILLIGNYLFFAGIGFWFFFKLLGPSITHREIVPQQKAVLKIAHEIKWSLVSLLIFFVAGLHIYFLWESGYTQIYTAWDEKGVIYGLLSFLIIHQIHDAYFYWTHRLMHENKWLKKYHMTHHASRNPTPWAAYAFHPVEGVVHTLFWYLVAFCVPVSVHMFFVFYSFQSYINMWGHTPYEFWNENLLTKWPWKMLNTPTHHILHHKYNNMNYGIYYNFWDNWCGTNHPKYAEEYLQVKENTRKGRTSKLLKRMHL